MSERILTPTVAQYDNFFETQWRTAGLIKFDPNYALRALTTKRSGLTQDQDLVYAGIRLTQAIATDRLAHMVVIKKTSNGLLSAILLPDPLCVNITSGGQHVGHIMESQRPIRVEGLENSSFFLVNDEIMVFNQSNMPESRLAVVYDYTSDRTGVAVGPLKAGAYQQLINGMITGPPHI